MAKKTIPDIYVKDINNYWESPRIREYEFKSFSNLCTFSNGMYVVFKKPSIKKDFCFDDSYDYDGAQRMAHHAATSESYFVEQNMKDFDRLEENVIKYEIGLRPAYINMNEDSKLCSYEFVDSWNKSESDLKYFLTKADKELLLKTIVEEKDKFRKRLNTYLKRYGMSHVNSWTYWGMA